MEEKKKKREKKTPLFPLCPKQQKRGEQDQKAKKNWKKGKKKKKKGKKNPPFPVLSNARGVGGSTLNWFNKVEGFNLFMITNERISTLRSDSLAPQWSLGWQDRASQNGARATSL